tara:strand:- start:1534 stop:1875 length:342 start_codon:yes stop_codon:yes gene_type:complete
MTNVMTKATKHFKSQLSGNLMKITVPEWETDVYYRPVSSFATESKIVELQQQGKTVEALVESLIAKALTPEGKPMFTRMDRTSLMTEVDPKVILRLCQELNANHTEYEEVVKK